MKSKPIIWAFGGGVQTICILTLIAEKRLQQPELAIMADTGREGTATWRYIETYAKPIMESIGLKFVISSHDLATVDLYAHNGDLLIPAFTANGKLPTYCSNEWKKYPNRRNLRLLGYGPGNPIVMWFGMSLDEIGRLRDSDVGWIKNHYPLVFDVPMKRYECLEQIKRFGLPQPPKSACWMCPNRNDEEWIEMRDNEPDDWSKAVELDKEIRDKDELHAVYLHKQRVPLNEVDLSPKPDKKYPLFDDCADTCWT